MRRVLAILLLLPLLAITWAREPYQRPGKDPHVRALPLRLPPAALRTAFLGPLRLEGTWRLASRDYRFFGYSAMIMEDDGRILAINDGGAYLRFAPPGAPPAVRSAPTQIKRIKLAGRNLDKTVQDVESAVRDPASGRTWVGMESTNAIVRLDRDLKEEARVTPAAMAGWGDNTGPEAMARLPDGRFVVIRETTRSLFESRLHQAVLFDGDPIRHPRGHRFLFQGPENFSVVDMALLPDGRALILMRRLIWPLPMRYAGRIVIADPARIRPGGIWRSRHVASLASILPVDNFEAIGVSPRADGRLVIWLMSDDNRMHVLQRTLLWKLTVDPRHLPVR